MTKNGADDQAGHPIPLLNYGASAELFANRHRNKQLFYRRFPSAAEALQFAIEELPERPANAWMVVDDDRFSGQQLVALYEAQAYPLTRRPPARAK